MCFVEMLPINGLSGALAFSFVRQNFLRNGFVVFEYLCAAGYLAQTDAQLRRDLPLRDIVVYHLHQLPSHRQVVFFSGREYLVEKPPHRPGIPNAAEHFN